MVASFEITNLTTRETARFGQEPASQYIFKDGDIDWGVASANHNTYNHPGQLGVSIASTHILPRDVLIRGYCHYVPTESERASLTRHQLEELVEIKIHAKKERLNAIINPLDNVRIAIGDYHLEGKPNSSVAYGTTIQENNEFFCRFLISVQCSNPLFIHTASVVSNLRNVEPRFHFPWVLPKEQGYVMSVIRTYKTLVVENTGAVATGCIITLIARGEITNPTIVNTTTGEQIRLTKALEAGEKIVINTVDGDERGVVGNLNGVEESYYRYWRFDNAWIQLPVGVSTFEYAVDEGDKSDLEVTVTFYPMKYGLEEM